jgi:hypothetical protein
VVGCEKRREAGGCESESGKHSSYSSVGHGQLEFSAALKTVASRFPILVVATPVR